jgi:hypothetical protein
VAALEVLPIEEDSLPEFYEPIREKIVQAFATHDLVPTRAGGHRASGDVFRGPSDISAVLTDDDLIRMTGNKWSPPLWCAKSPQVNQRSDKFLDSLSIEEWGWDELKGALDCDFWTIYHKDDKGRPERLKDWLSTKEDSWLQRFYALLHETVSRNYQSLNISELCLVRARKGHLEKMVSPGEVYFPLADADREKNDIFWVKKECYSSGKSASQKDSARLFLAHAGVRVFDEKADLTLIIDAYKKNSFPDIATHIRHIKRFLAFFKANPKSLDIFLSKSFLLGVKAQDEDKKIFCSPDVLYLDSPYEETGLEGVLKDKSRYKLL